MVNTTQMAKSFKKKTFDFLRLKQTKAFIEEFEKRGGNSLHEIVRVIVFQKIKDNAMEIHYLSDIIDNLKKIKNKES